MCTNATNVSPLLRWWKNIQYIFKICATVNVSSVHKVALNFQSDEAKPNHAAETWTASNIFPIYERTLFLKYAHAFAPLRWPEAASLGTRSIRSTLSAVSFYTRRTFFSSVPWRDSHHRCLFLLAELFVLFPTRSSSSHISSSFSPWENTDSLAFASLWRRRRTD